MPPKTKKKSIFRRTPEQRAATKALGKGLAEVRLKAKPKPATRKPAKKIPAIKKSIAQKAVRSLKAVPKRKPPGVVKKAVTAVKKTAKAVKGAVRTATAKRTQARLKPTTPKHKTRR